MGSKHTPEPPWIVFNRTDKGGLVDILPAGRQGVVLEGVDPALAKALCKAAGEWQMARQLSYMTQLKADFTAILDGLDKLVEESKATKAAKQAAKRLKKSKDPVK